MRMCKECGEVYETENLRDGVCRVCRTGDDSISITNRNLNEKINSKIDKENKIVSNVDKNVIYCKNCGEKNDLNNKQCKKCGTIMNTLNSPLDGTDRIKVVSFFAFLVLPFFWLGGSVIIVLLILGAIYIMKKDRYFSPILKAKKYIKYYLITLSVLTVLGAIAGSFNEPRNEIYNPEYDLYTKKFYDYIEKTKNMSNDIKYMDEDELSEIVKSTYNLKEPAMYIKNPNLTKERTIYTVAGATISLISVFIAFKLFMWLFNILFFDPLQRHKNWVVNKGIFTNPSTKREESNDIDIIGRDNLSAFSVADELIKWNDLREKGLITQSEFEKAKQKLLNAGES